MAETGGDTEVYNLIQGTYVPFLKKLIAFLEKNKKATPENLNKLKAIYQIFTTSPQPEQIETFRANKKKLQDWYKKAQKDKTTEDGEKPTKGAKRSFVPSDTESSQGASETAQPAAKKPAFTNSDDSNSSQPAILLVQSVNQHSTSFNKPSDSLIHASQIKKEKIEKSNALKPPKPVVSNSTPAPIQPKQVVSQVVPSPPAISQPSADGPITFTCASCQFQTQEETEFMKHARTDHRTDLSMWCKQCGKCFSNAGVLVSHIKERACTKEEMIYKCGVKDCIFETTSGQTFVHHLRHCHKGSPFIFCVHCQKIFTLPHCLILHMQDDCPFKDRNRRNGSSGGAGNAEPPPPPKTTPTPVVSQPRVTTPVSLPSIRPQAPSPSFAPRPIVPRAVAPAASPASIVRAPSSLIPSYRARGRGNRGRGRGRGRVRISDSSDSDDPDDPSWHPEELLGEQGLRRSGRWAKKINDVMNPEPSTSGVPASSAKKSFTSAEINSKMINCPCCDSMAAFQSVLEDHYIASHKVPNKNACLVCHLKFENTRAFLDHFEEHRKGILPTKPPDEVITETQTQSKQVDVSDIVSVDIESNQGSALPPEVEPYDGVLTSIDGAKITNPMTKDTTIKIPYQSAIHDKNLKDSKLKKFEELKSPNDLITMKTIQKLKHFFKCGLYSCTYTTDNKQEFSDHLRKIHDGKRFHCCYCLKDELNSDYMANHIASKHNKRIYQCSKCFYRAYSKAHVQIHIKNGHTQDPFTEILICDPVESPETPDESKTPDESNSVEKLNTTWPYICAIGQCDYSTFDPKEFKKHNETVHRTVSVFFCHYCKVDFLTFKRLMNHYRLHGLNVFQCNYCIHGAETKEEILLHLCNAHADDPLKAYMRGSQEEASSEVKQLNRGAQEDSNETSFPEIATSKKDLPVENLSNESDEKMFTGCENELYHIVDNASYPKHVLSMCYPRYLKNLLSNIICGVSFCNEIFPSINAYVTHLRNSHEALNFPCPNCPEMCNSMVDFKNHLLCHASKLYACDFKDCEFYHWRKEDIIEHKKEHGDSDSEENVIPIREFDSSEDETKLHSLYIDAELPDVERTFTCLFCKYKCSKQNVMKNHMYKEMAYQRFDCSLCDKKCLSRKEIKDHFVTSHSSVDILCSADFNIELETMVKSALSQQEKLQDVKLTESCDMCCRKFSNPLRLQSHLFVCLQKEYRPFQCKHCKKCYVNSLALKYHTDEHHHPELMSSSLVPNSAIEEDIEKNLQKVRLKQLKDVFEEKKIDADIDEKSYKVKFYTCSDCAFEAYHKFNVQRHNEEKHEGNAKVMKGRESNLNNNGSSQLDENSNDSLSSKNLAKIYSCGYCIKKMLTIQEVEKHVKKAHVNKNNDYFYYYSPDSSNEFVADDKEIYECAYCKSTKENLFSLKKHADLMHSEMEFKVKGFISGIQPHNNYLACGYCYMRVDNRSQLQEHSTSSHPLLALKSIGDFPAVEKISKSKRITESSDDFPNKRVKFNAMVYVCSHCGGAFSSVEAVTTHSKRAHSRLEVQYKKMDQYTNSTESTDFKFYKCEFCKFTSEKHHLDKHLASKHKMRVTCSYCNKRFEYASKLKEHHDVSHKDLPIKYSQETVNLSSAVATNDSIVEDKNGDKIEDSVIPEPASHYGKEPLPIDLNSLTVNMKTKEGESADLPLVYVTERFNLFPRVVLKDVMKK